jgi:hypothetical protein
MIVTNPDACPQNHACPAARHCPAGAITQDNIYSAPRSIPNRVDCGLRSRACGRRSPASRTKWVC